MAATLRLDLVDGSRLTTLKNGGTRDTRIGFVDGLATNVPADFKRACLQVGGMPQPNDPHPSIPQLRVVGFDVRPVGPSQAFVSIIYEGRPPGGGTQQEKLAIRDTVTLAQLTTQKTKDGKPLRVFVGTDTSATPKIASVTYPIPMRNRILYGLFKKPRPDAWRECIRKVNATPFEGFDAGYWLCSYYDESFSDADRLWRVTVGFTTKQDEDWSSYWFIRGADGNVADINEGVLAQLMSGNYATGIVHNTQGVLKVGLYDATDFHAVFGNFILRPQ